MWEESSSRMGSPFRIRLGLGQSYTVPTDSIYYSSCPRRERGTASLCVVDENGVEGKRSQERVYTPGTYL